MATKKSGGGSRRKPDGRRLRVEDMHEAAMMVEGFLRKTVQAEQTLKALAKVPPKKWVRIGLEGLIRALDESKE